MKSQPLDAVEVITQLPDARVVAFVDILGFGEIITRMSSDASLYRDVLGAFSEIQKMRKSIETHRNDKDNRPNDLQVTFFSDCIVISDLVDNTENVLMNAGLLAKNLLVLGFLCRGGVAIGWTHHKDNVVFGKGMLDAYELERQVAYYPRIVLQPQVFDNVPRSGGPRLRLQQGDDGALFIDPFPWLRQVQGEGRQPLWHDDPVNEDDFQAVKRGLEVGLQRTHSHLRYFVKWQWTAKQFNAAVSRMRSSCKPIEMINGP